MRKYFISSLIILIMAFTFCIGYFSVPQNIYADSSTDQWTSVTTNQELADAFRYYCKSRNLAIEGSVADALTSFTTNSFNTICNSLGIDITALQAHLKRSTDSNGKVQFLFDEFGVTAFNRIFAEFLQNNNLEVGDVADQADNTLYSGDYFTDADGYSCLVYYVTNPTYYSSSGAYGFQPSNLTVGSPYRYDTLELVNNYKNGISTYTFNFANNDQYNFSLTGINSSNVLVRLYSGQNANSRTFYKLYSESSANVNCWGVPAIVKNVSNDKYYFCRIGSATNSDKNILYQWDNTDPNNGCGFYPLHALGDYDYDFTSTIIFLTTNNNTINNNTYNDNKQTVINNEGDVYNYDYDDDDPPVNPPSGGGGDDPSGGGDDDPIDWPNITFPNILPHLQIPNLKDKFPFSIPWDLIAFYAILNVDPVCPEIETDINLGIVQWHVDLSLEDFEPAAEICRDMYFIAFCVGLIIVTRDLIRG